jgi:hypothetical protein
MVRITSNSRILCKMHIIRQTDGPNYQQSPNFVQNAYYQSNRWSELPAIAEFCVKCILSVKQIVRITAIAEFCVKCILSVKQIVRITSNRRILCKMHIISQTVCPNYQQSPNFV